MLKFFKKIRRKLLSESKFNKYLVYAAGEIILVVIGILIALQFNDWSKEKERNILEHRILSEMHTNLKMDSVDMEGNIERNTKVLNSAQAILDQLENQVAWNDSMKTHYARLDNYISKVALVLSSYENLKSLGFDLIRNNELRTKIHQVYAQQYPFVVRMEKEHLEAMKYSLLLPQLTSKLETISRLESMPVNYRALMEDNTFKETIRLYINTQKGFIGLYIELLELETELIKMIELELESL